MIDLQPFCSTDDTRPYLMKPYSRGEFTYATNNHVLVRVPRRDDAPEHDKAPNVESVFIKFHKGEFVPAPPFDVPAFETTECDECAGGTEPAHDCPECECECETCDGTGSIVEKASLTIRGSIFDAKYIRLLLALPSLELPTTIDAIDAMPFKFEGGDGLLMPMRPPHKKTLGEIFGETP
jgi:hypothetical protein